MTGLGSLLITVLTLSLLAAVSPMILLNASRLLASDGPRSVRSFTAGAVTVLVVIAAAGAGVLGAGLAVWINREITSQLVDGLLALLLLVFGIHMARQVRRPPASTAKNPHQSAYGFGVVTMVTNYTSLPLVLSAAQHIGAAQPPLWEAVPLVLLVVVITALPAWLPLAMDKAAPTLLHRMQAFGRKREREAATHPRRTTVHWSAWLPVGACFLGAAVLALHAAGVAV